MQLGNLRGAIRKAKGNPVVTVNFAGQPMRFVLMKGPLLDELERAFPGGKAVETGIALNYDGDACELIDETGGAVEQLAAKVAESTAKPVSLLDDDPAPSPSPSPTITSLLV